MNVVRVGLTADQAALDGPLDSDQVFYQYLCTTTGGGHDPNGTPDDRVRPSHAALHGCVFRLDDPTAPVPPIDFGCRCALRYVGGRDTLAARVFGETAPSAPTTRTEAYAAWLRGVEDIDMIATKVAEAAPADRLAVAWDELRARNVSNPADLARMLVEALAILTARSGSTPS